MDDRKLKLLKYLLDHCGEGYKVMDTQQVIAVIGKYNGSFELFEQDIEFLKQMDYIDLQHIDEDNFCLSIEDNSKIVEENIKVEKKSKKFLRYVLFLSMLVSGMMSFLGSFVASLLFR